MRAPIVIAMLSLVTGCVGTPAGLGGTLATGTAPISAGDTTGLSLVPPGFGSLHQDDIAFHISTTGLMIRVVPLDESVIRVLTPDSYRAMRDLQQSYRQKIDTIAKRYGGRPVSVWLVSFYGVEPDARFTPLDLTITSSGRDFRPYDAIPLTAGFGEQRLRQRETQNALYVFDGDIDLNQLVTASYQGVQDNSWDQTLQQIERERALIRARARKTGATAAAIS